MTNPYNSPLAVGRNRNSSTEVQGPAIALITVSLIALTLGTLGLIVDILFIVTGMVEELDAVNNGPISEHTQVAIRSIWGIVLLVASSFVLYGAVQMKNLKNYRLAKTASIVAMIPLIGPCYILGIPFGIWAFVTLEKPGIRQSFS